MAGLLVPIGKEFELKAALLGNKDMSVCYDIYFMNSIRQGVIPLEKEEWALAALTSAAGDLGSNSNYSYSQNDLDNTPNIVLQRAITMTCEASCATLMNYATANGI